MTPGLFETIVKISLITLFVITGSKAFSQTPVIGFVDRSKGANHDLITISGNHFGNDPIVHFGAVQGKVEFAQDQIIEVRVPYGATFNHISVTNNSGLSGYSEEPFFLSF